MQDLTTGVFCDIDPEESATLQRIFAAGGRELPIFALGDEVEIRNAHFKVLALSGKLLVLEGIPAPPRPGLNINGFPVRTMEMDDPLAACVVEFGQPGGGALRRTKD